MMSPQLEDIVRKVRSDERIAPAEALVLWHEAPLWLLGELAARRKERVSGDKVYFNRNFHIEPTNRCVFNCRFCSYRRPAGDPEAWDYTMDEIEQIARERQGKGITEVHIVGGVHPDHGLDYYTDMIRRVKSILPGTAVKAFTAIELSYMIRKAGLTTEEGLRQLKQAGTEEAVELLGQLDWAELPVLLQQSVAALQQLFAPAGDILPAIPEPMAAASWWQELRELCGLLERGDLQAIERAEALDMQVPAALRRAFAPFRQAVEALDFTQALTLGRDLLNQAPGG